MGGKACLPLDLSARAAITTHQTGAYTPEMDFLTVLEAESPRSRVSAGLVVSEASLFGGFLPSVSGS